MPRTRHIVALTALLLALAAPAFAHVPALEGGDGATQIGGPEVSRAIYGYLAPGEEQDVYVFTVTRPVTTEVGIIVPAYAEHRDFRPAIAIETSGASPVAIQDPQADPRATEWEPFSLTTFWVGGSRSVSFEPGRECTLRVVPASGTMSGRYVLVFGGPEAFTAGDWARTLRDLPRIWFGAYGGAPARFNGYALVPLGITAALLGLAILAIVRAVRKRSAG